MFFSTVLLIGLWIEKVKTSVEMYLTLQQTAVTGKCVLKPLSKHLHSNGLVMLNSLESNQETHGETNRNTQLQRDGVPGMTVTHSSVVCFRSVSSPRSSEELIHQ